MGAPLFIGRLQSWPSTRSYFDRRLSMAAEAQMKSAGTELEKRTLRLHKGGTGILKIGKTLGIGTGTVQRVLMEQPRPFDVGATA